MAHDHAGLLALGDAYSASILSLQTPSVFATVLARTLEGVYDVERCGLLQDCYTRTCHYRAPPKSIKKAKKAKKHCHEMHCELTKLNTSVQQATGDALGKGVLEDRKETDMSARNAIACLSSLARVDMQRACCELAVEGLTPADWLCRPPCDWPLLDTMTFEDFTKRYLLCPSDSAGLAPFLSLGLRELLAVDVQAQATPLQQLCVVCLQHFVAAVLNALSPSIHYRFPLKCLATLFASAVCQLCTLWMADPLFALTELFSGTFDAATQQGLLTVLQVGAPFALLRDLDTLCKALALENTRGLHCYGSFPSLLRKHKLRPHQHHGCCDLAHTHKHSHAHPHTHSENLFDKALFAQLDELFFEAYAQVASIEFQISCSPSPASPASPASPESGLLLCPSGV